MSDFDYFKFYDLTDEIEKYLGTLKGNELVREYDDRVFSASEDGLFVPWETPDPEYPCRFLGLSVPYNPDNTDIYKETVEEMETHWGVAFANGAKWADGIGGYIRDLCADLTIPNASLLKSSVQKFGDTAAAVEAVVPVGWRSLDDDRLTLDFNSWDGLSSDACQQVVEVFQAKFRDEYAFYFTYAQAIYAGAGAVVVQSQKGLNRTMEAIRDILRAQLAAWQESGGHQPQDRPAPPEWLADLGKVVDNVLNLIPVVSDVKGALENIAGIADGLLGLFDAEIEWQSGAFDAQTAEEVYTRMTTVLQDDYLKKMRDGLDTLQTERANAVMTAQNGIDPWLMDKLSGLDSEPWEHQAES